MRARNFDLLKALWDKKVTQVELVRLAKLSSEARLSRIINGTQLPDPEEIERISRVLKLDRAKLGFSSDDSKKQGRVAP